MSFINYTLFFQLPLSLQCIHSPVTTGGRVDLNFPSVMCTFQH